jgi:hypothetical protein
MDEGRLHPDLFILAAFPLAAKTHYGAAGSS